MFKIHKEEIELDGKKIILETGKITRQANGAIIATCGETVVISTVVGVKKVDSDTDYFPLQVNYQEKYYEKYLNENKNIYLVGITFDEESRNIKEFVWEKLR